MASEDNIELRESPKKKIEAFRESINDFEWFNTFITIFLAMAIILALASYDLGRYQGASYAKERYKEVTGKYCQCSPPIFDRGKPKYLKKEPLFNISNG